MHQETVRIDCQSSLLLRQLPQAVSGEIAPTLQLHSLHGLAPTVFCSTCCVYGTGSPATVLIDESFPLEPISGYGQGKADCEPSLAAARSEHNRFGEKRRRAPGATGSPGVLPTARERLFFVLFYFKC